MFKFKLLSRVEAGFASLPWSKVYILFMTQHHLPKLTVKDRQRHLPPRSVDLVDVTFWPQGLFCGFWSDTGAGSLAPAVTWEEAWENLADCAAAGPEDESQDRCWRGYKV